MKSKPSKSSLRHPLIVGIAPTEPTKSSPISEVAARAYSKYENSGYASGNDVQHWLEAESELTPIGVRL